MTTNLITAKITAIIESGLLRKFDEKVKVLEEKNDKVHSYFANERTDWIMDLPKNKSPIGLKITVPENEKENLSNIFNSNIKWKDFKAEGWSVAELFIFILSVNAIDSNQKKIALVCMCYTTDLGDFWDLPDEGGFKFEIIANDGKKIEFLSPKI